ncbi:hypothetical protein [uncultured Paludibaculum sp.]|uniref:phage head spike fiber domain-containing protein n=1 Tax=uncultured Paludibaculum sp. TaxID=1765020 RepID=UPI002AAB6CF7|nr:hypothetical protein [uncultured Paludibaculum sp.]
MPIYFPQINASGLITQRPYQAGLHFSTTTQVLPGGSQQAWGWRGMGLSNFPDRHLGQWDLNYSAITDAEVAVLLAFFTEMRGRLGEFTYLDPSGNLIPASEDFAAASWTKQTVSVGPEAADPFGGNRARLMTGTGENSMMWCTILPDGGAGGYVLNVSLWAKATTEGQQLMLSFIDSGFSIISSVVLPVPQTWTRIDHCATLASNSYVRVLIGGGGTWPGTGISMFGAQCVPMPGPGGYTRTPGNPGLHPKCRFDTDAFSPRYVGPNQISLKLPIVEYF